MARRAVFPREFAIAEREADLEAGGGIIEALRFRPRHRLFEEGIDLGLVVDAPARKEGGQRHLGKHRDLGAGGRGLLQQVDEAVDRLGTRSAALDRSGLADRDDQALEPWRRLLDRSLAEAPDRRRRGTNSSEAGLRLQHSVGDHRHAAHQHGGRLASHLLPS